MALIASSLPAASTSIYENSAHHDFAGASTAQSLQPSPELSRGLVTSASTGGRPRAVADRQSVEAQRSQSEYQNLPTSNGLPREARQLARAQTGERSLAHHSRPLLPRRRTDSDLDRLGASYQGMEDAGEIRHGWEDQYNSSEFLGQLNSVLSPTSMFDCKF